MRRKSYPEEFEKLWNGFDSAFGEKGSKKLAFDQFKRMEITGEDVDYILESYFDQLEVKKNLRAMGEFASPFQHVERYLRNERFEDEISIPSVAKRQSKSERADQAVRDYLSQQEENGGNLETATVHELSFRRSG